MMNLYGDDRSVYGGEKRNEDRYKMTLKEKILFNIGMLKSSIETSQWVRNRNLKKLRKKIPETSEKELETLLQMKDVINSLDLNDPRFGDVLEDDLIKMLDKKIERAKQIAAKQKGEVKQKEETKKQAESESEEGGMQF